MQCVILILALLSCCSGAAPTRLYGLWTTFFADQLEVQTVGIDVKNGSWWKIADNFEYLTDESATYDGISGFDSDAKIAYYATDMDSSFIFRTDVTSGCLKAPISLNAMSISTIKYDNINKRMVISYIDANANLVIAGYSTQRQGWQVINSINNYKKDWVETALDVNSQTYYFTGVNGTTPFLGHFSIASANAPSTVSTLDCGISVPFYPEHLSYDPIRKLLVGVAAVYKPSLMYMLLTINPTSSQCKATSIKTQEFGIGTAFAYHPSAHSLYMAWAPNGMGKLYTIDILSKEVVGVTMNGGIVLPDLYVDNSV